MLPCLGKWQMGTGGIPVSTEVLEKKMENFERRQLLEIKSRGEVGLIRRFNGRVEA